MGTNAIPVVKKRSKKIVVLWIGVIAILAASLYANYRQARMISALRKAGSDLAWAGFLTELQNGMLRRDSQQDEKILSEEMKDPLREYLVTGATETDGVRYMAVHEQCDARSYRIRLVNLKAPAVGTLILGRRGDLGNRGIRQWSAERVTWIDGSKPFVMIPDIPKFDEEDASMNKPEEQ